MLFTPLTYRQQAVAAESGYRYWRYLVGSVIAGHHPRVSRIDLLIGASVYNVATFVADNCSDSGTIPNVGDSYSKDFGTKVLITDAQFYNTYAGGARASNISLQSSDDNTNWTTRFTGAANSDQVPTTPRCGLHTIYQLTAV